MVGDKVGEVGFPYFDLFILEDGADFETVFGDPVIAEFAANWVKRWGQAPDGTPSDNYKGAMVSIVATPNAG